MSNEPSALLRGRYRLVSQLASGGMAVVYKAVDDMLARTVAIKVLRPSLTVDPAFVTRFQNEARSIANLSHPNIVIVHDVGSDGPTHFIVMEMVDGSDLKKVIKTHGAMPLDRVLNLSTQICSGLGFAHRARIVHADVKPQNVLLTKTDIVKITDFGIAQALSDTQPAARASVVWGSPHYFAPEQAQGEKPTAASDVYSIGVVMFEMLTGRLPYIGTNQQELAMAHIQAPVPDVRDFNATVPEELAHIVKKVMSKNPNDRYGTADQLGTVIKTFRERSGGHTMRSQRPTEYTAPPQGAPTQVASMPAQGAPTTEPRNIPAPPEAMPTQRYSIAPDAPGQANYRQTRQPQQQIPPQQASGASVQHPRAFTMPPRANIPNPSGMTGDSQNLSNSQRVPYAPRYQAEPEPQFQLDGVTLALGFLAFMSVACLFPLYFFALQA